MLRHHNAIIQLLHNEFFDAAAFGVPKRLRTQGSAQGKIHCPLPRRVVAMGILIQRRTRLLPALEARGLPSGFYPILPWPEDLKIRNHSWRFIGFILRSHAMKRDSTTRRCNDLPETCSNYLSRNLLSIRRLVQYLHERFSL